MCEFVDRISRSSSGLIILLCLCQSLTLCLPDFHHLLYSPVGLGHPLRSLAGCRRLTYSFVLLSSFTPGLCESQTHLSSSIHRFSCRCGGSSVKVLSVCVSRISHIGLRSIFYCTCYPPSTASQLPPNIPLHLSLVL